MYLVIANYSPCIAMQTTQVGEEAPLRRLAGHADEVNAVRWSPSGRLLASCSDDTTAKVRRPIHRQALADWFTSCMTWQASALHEHPLSTHARHWPVTTSPALAPTTPSAPLTSAFSPPTYAHTSPCHTHTPHARVQVWSLERDKPLHDFSGNAREIYTVRWRPAGPGSANPNQQLLLATTGFDGMVKLYDVDAGRCSERARGGGG